MIEPLQSGWELLTYFEVLALGLSTQYTVEDREVYVREVATGKVLAYGDYYRLVNPSSKSV